MRIGERVNDNIGKLGNCGELCRRNNQREMRKALTIIMAAVAIFAAGGCIALGANTLGSMTGVCCAAGVVTAVCCLALRRLWEKITLTTNRWVNIGAGVLVMFPILLCALLCVNYFGADDTTQHTENAVVERLYSKTRHHTKRVSRRTVGVGEEYKVYYAEVSMPSVANKEISLNLRQWQKLHKGDTIRVQVAQGALGMPVMKRRGVPVEVPQSRYRY